MTTKFDEFLGWIGAAAIIVAYALNTFGIITTHDISYHVLNLCGALGIIYISAKKKVYQPTVVNSIWFVIAFIALIKILADS